MENLSLSNSTDLKNNFGKYAGKLVFVKYIDPNKNESIIKQVVISSEVSNMTTHLPVFFAFNNNLLQMGLAMPMIEEIWFEENYDVNVIYSSEIKKETELNGNKVK